MLFRSLGAYNVQIAMTDSSGRTYRVYVGRIEVQALARHFAPPAPAHAANLPLGNLVALAGYDFRAEAAGQTLTLYWHALAETDLDYTVFVHVLDAGGRIVAQRDVMPRDNSYPTSLWMTDEYVADEHPFSLPRGSYSLEVGLYVPETGETLGGGMIGEVVVP